MNQPRKHSAYESIANIFAGYWVAFFANLYLLPVVGVHISVEANFKFSILMTLVSFARSYTLRRLFERFRPKPFIHTVDGPATIDGVAVVRTPENIPDWRLYVCGACGKVWDGVQCGQHLNGWPFPTCYPMEFKS